MFEWKAMLKIGIVLSVLLFVMQYWWGFYVWIAYFLINILQLAYKKKWKEVNIRIIYVIIFYIWCAILHLNFLWIFAIYIIYKFIRLPNCKGIIRHPIKSYKYFVRKVQVEWATEILKLTPSFLSKDNDPKAVKDYLNNSSYAKWRNKWQQDLDKLEKEGIKL